MTADEFNAAGRTLYGGRGWLRRMAEVMRVDYSTVRRWATGAVPVPGIAEALVRCLLESKAARNKPTSTDTRIS